MDNLKSGGDTQTSNDRSDNETWTEYAYNVCLEEMLIAQPI